MKRRSLWLSLAAVLLILPACSNSWANNEKERKEFPPLMTGEISVNGILYEMTAGNMKWERKVGTATEVIQTDASSPGQLAESLTAVPVKPGDAIKIEVEENPELAVYTWPQNNRGEEVGLKDQQLLSPADKGRYTYEVLADWGDGEVSYTFVVEVR